jgi:hypothetical protein
MPCRNSILTMSSRKRRSGKLISSAQLYPKNPHGFCPGSGRLVTEPLAVASGLETQLACMSIKHKDPPDTICCAEWVESLTRSLPRAVLYQSSVSRNICKSRFEPSTEAGTTEVRAILISSASRTKVLGTFWAKPFGKERRRVGVASEIRTRGESWSNLLFAVDPFSLHSIGEFDYGLLNLYPLATARGSVKEDDRFQL